MKSKYGVWWEADEGKESIDLSTTNVMNDDEIKSNGWCVRWSPY